MSLFKPKKIKMSNRGITFSDKNLFPIGTEYKYIVENNKIIILPAESSEKMGTVSRKKRGNKKPDLSKKKDNYVPLIDIRNNGNHAEAFEALSKFKTLQVIVKGDEIIVEGYELIEAEEQKKENFISKAVNKVKNSFKKKVTTAASNVVDITNVLNVKKKLTVVLSKKDLSKAVGEQISFDLFNWDVIEDTLSSATSSHSQHISNALKNIHIPLQIASLFSGAGVMDEGFKQAGFDIVFALEKDKEAAMTYRHNHGDHIHVADITKFDKSLITKAPVVIGGPPCQGFSNSNRKTKFLDNPNNMLLKEYIKAIKENENCQVFVIENVPQILTAGEGAFKEEIYEQLSDFEITSGVLRAPDFGDPQDRSRAIFIGSKIGKIELPKPIYSPDHYRTVRDAFEGLTDDIPNQLDYSKSRPDSILRMKYIPQGGNWENIPEHLRNPRMMSGNTHSMVFSRMEWDKPSRTIANPRKNMLLHPILQRILSIRECARLFSLADSFEFLGSLSSMQQQICNAVPVGLAKAIAYVIKNAIMQFNIRNRTEGFQLV